MSKIITILLGLFLTAHCVVLSASPEKKKDEAKPPESKDPERFIKKQKKLHEEKIKEANDKYSEAKKTRTKKVVEAIEEYIEAVKKTRKYWTEKGNLEEALKYKELQEKLEKSLKKHKEAIAEKNRIN